VGRHLSPSLLVRILVPATIVAGIVVMAFRLDGQPGLGRDPAFTVLAGAIFGLLLQRSRFCFFCILRELFEERDARGALGILAALAIGSLGYLVVMQPWLPDPLVGRLPPDAHIGPVSWVLVAGGLSFGLGMTLSGSCISAHLYRLGEGSTLAPFALAGAVGGFMLGFASWNWLYIGTLATAPVVWLPGKLGYGGAAALQAALLGVLALLLLLRVRWPAPAGVAGAAPTPPDAAPSILAAGSSSTAGRPGSGASASACSAFSPTCAPSHSASPPSWAAARAPSPARSAGFPTGCPGWTASRAAPPW
jgi:uncharacterized protein